MFVIHLFEAADHIAGQHDGANHRNRCCGPHNSCQQCCQQDGTQECTRVIIDHSGQDGVRSAQFRDQRSANQTNQAGKQQIRYIDQQSCGKGGVPCLTATLGTAYTQEVLVVDHVAGAKVERRGNHRAPTNRSADFEHLGTAFLQGSSHTGHTICLDQRDQRQHHNNSEHHQDDVDLVRLGCSHHTANNRIDQHNSRHNDHGGQQAELRHKHVQDRTQ